MSEVYFSKFPIIAYGGVEARDISERVAIIAKEKIAPFDFYPYELANKIRPDQLADAYYGDPTLDWSIFLTNDIVDPYYGWHLYDLDFDDYIIQKYGDLEIAFQTIAFWRTNWPSDTFEIPPNHFEDLPDSFKKYYQPTWGPKAQIMSYARRQDDMTMNTNRIVKYEVANNTVISTDDLVAFNYSLEFTGQGQVSHANESVIIVKDLRGANTTSGTINLLSNNNANVAISSTEVLVFNIPELEGDFWEAVSWYDVENEMNEDKRFIDVIGNDLIFNVTESIRKALLPSNNTPVITDSRHLRSLIRR